jgi:hypothetical protein
VLGVLAFLSGLFVIGGVLGLVSIILASVVLVRRNPGKSLALTALVLSVLAVVTSVVVLVATASIWSSPELERYRTCVAGASSTQVQSCADDLQDDLQDALEERWG